MIEVNLLPKSQRSGGDRKRSRGRSGPSLGGLVSGKSRSPWGTALLLALIAVPAAGLFLWWSQSSRATELQTRLDAATADSARLAELRVVSDSLTARRQEIRERVALIQELDRGRFVWPHLLDEISRALPRSAWVASISQTGAASTARVQVQGIAANPLAITEFVRNLDASDYIGDVRLLGSQRQSIRDGQVSAQAFTITAQFTEPPDARRTEPIIANTGG